MKTKMFIIIFSQCLTLAYAELPKASDYFPLQIGNKWQYRRTYSSGQFTGSPDRFLEIVSDSLVGDTLLVYISKWTSLQRPDSTKIGYGYYYYNEDSTIVYRNWNYPRKPPFPGMPWLDTGHGIGHRWRFWWGDAIYTFAVTDTGSAEIFDRNMSWLDVYSVDPRYDSLVVTTVHARFVKGLGPVRWGLDTLVYAQINGVEYGTKVNVDHNPQAMEQNPDGFELQVYPNPFNESTTIHFNRISSQHIQIQIYDMLGRSVRTIPVSSGLVGPVTVRWDGKDDQGNVLASGLYWVMLKQKNQFESQKILYLK